jgi:hypothetical protein
MQATRLETAADATGSATSPLTAEKSRSRRGTFLKWLRKIHGWIGLWGAVLGLLFGVTGFLQNHRATLKIKVGEPSVSTIQIAVPTPPPASPRELAKFLQTELKIDRPAQRVSKEPEQPVKWGDRSAIQPEHWMVRFIAPNALVTADLWKGGSLINVERRDQGLMNTLEGLHRGEGAQVGWILLADSIAGSMILLSLTGVLLWTELNRRKTIGATIFIVSLGTVIVLALQSL